MPFCPNCGTPLPDSKNFCPWYWEKTAAPERKPTTPNPPKPAHIHGISGCTTSLVRGTCSILDKKMAPLAELYHLDNYYEGSIVDPSSGIWLGGL